MSFTYRYRKYIILGIIIVLVIGGGSFYYYNNLKTKEKISKKEVLVSSKKDSVKKTTVKEEGTEEYKVDIKGAVNNPGLYSLKIGSRVSDVITLAGGLREDANTTVINLSKKIKDEMVIIIYTNLEVEDFKKTKEVEKEVLDNCKNYNDITNDACIDNEESNSIDGVISLNNATIEDLTKLPGIGDAKAKSIIEYRDSKGGFTNVDELKDISGIGEAIFEKIKDYVTT